MVENLYPKETLFIRGVLAELNERMSIEKLKKMKNLMGRRSKSERVCEQNDVRILPQSVSFVILSFPFKRPGIFRKLHSN